MKINDEDYYVILDVDFKASPETITQAYRRLARKYHPDKHSEATRKEAEVVFNRIKTAYDVLIDPHKRAIYDTVGPEGLKRDGWRVMKRHMTAEDIRDEYNRIIALETERRLTSQAKPRGVTTISLDATEFFPRRPLLIDDENNYNGDDELNDTEVSVIKIPSVEFSSMSMSQSIDANLSGKHGLTFSGTMQTKNGTGDASVGVAYKYRFSRNNAFNFLYQIGNSSVLSFGAERSINDKTSCNGRLVFVISSYGIGLQRIQGSVVHKCTENIQGTITVKEGVVPTLTTSLLYVNATFGYELTTSYKMSENNQTISIDAAYRFNKNESKVSVSLALAQDKGLSVEYGCETRVLDINILGASLQIGPTSGVTLKLRFTRANQLFYVPILLSDELHSSAIFYGTALPLAAYKLFDKYYVKRMYKTVND
ncbi:DnaJ-like subfamily C member 11, partial [Fragariocoptes setiger]